MTYAERMQRWGDAMQSEASRLASALHDRDLDYEAAGARHEVFALVDEWTALRTAAEDPHDTELAQWSVFKLCPETASGRLNLAEVATVPAVDGDRAMILVAEDKPELAGTRLLALEASTTRGDKVRISYAASLER